MRINDMTYGTLNKTPGMNEDHPSFDDAVFSDNKKSAALFDVEKSAVGFFATKESKPAAGKNITYTFNEAKGREAENFYSKLKNEAENGHDNDKELVKNLTGDDYEALEDEGMSVREFSKDRLERAIERIKENRKTEDMRLEEGIEKKQEYREGVERMAVYASLNTGTDRLIAKMLYEADIPVTEDNINNVKQAAAKTAGTEKLSDHSKGYLIKNSLPPTIENIYRASHSGEMRIAKLDENAWSQLKPKASEIVDDAFGKSNDKVTDGKNLENARWLIECDIPLTKENLVYKSELDGLDLKDSESTEDIYRAAVEALRKGLPADAGLLIDKGAAEEKAVAEELTEIIETARNISEMAIQLTAAKTADVDQVSLENLAVADMEIEADKGNGMFSSGISEEIIVKEVKIRLRLEEVRYGLNMEAGRRLMSKGINIMSDSLMRVTEGIRELEKEYFRDLYKEIALDSEELKGSAEPSEESLDLAVKTSESLRSISGTSVEIYRMTFEVRHTITLGELSEKAEELNGSADIQGKVTISSLKAAAISYESSATEIRTDLGDSIKKAFGGSVDDLLGSNGFELTEANRRAVRILGYNSMEITAESITEIKYYDAKVTGLTERMTPPVVMEMIRNGLNPLDMNIDDLDREVSSLLEKQGTTVEQSYGEFLVKMDESGSITGNERNAYIGIYRLLYNISKNDGAALGAALNSGKELSLRNLMTEVRSFVTDIDLKIDDETDQSTSHYKNSVTGQIDEAFIYQNALLDRALKVTESSAWNEALSGKNIGDVTLESLTGDLTRYNGDTGAAESAREIADVMTANSTEAAFLNSFGIKDSYTNRVSAGEVLLDTGAADSAATVSSQELNEALSSREKTDELLGIKTRMANVGIGEAFKTAITAQAAAELNSRVERIEMVSKLAGKGHYRFKVDDGDGEGSKQINLTLIQNTGNSGTVSVQISKEGYSLQADLNMVIMDQKYNGPSVKGSIHLKGDGQADPDAENEIRKSLESRGINVDSLSMSSSERSASGYLSYLSEQKSNEQDGTIRQDVLYSAAGAIVSAML